MIDHLIIHKISIVQTDNQIESNEMDNFDLNELMDLAEAFVGALIDVIFCRLMDQDFALEDPETVMLLTALTKILGHDNSGDGKTTIW